MNYWKQFRLCKLANARVIEIIHASKLWYPVRFYPSKIKWLIDLCIDPNLNTHLALMDRLLGEQKGKCRGKDLFFTTEHYASKVLKISTPFYKEAIKAMTTLDLRKQVLDPRDEKLFYYPIFQADAQNYETL